MQVTAAVVQVVEGTLVGQGQDFEVAQFVVVVFKLPGSAGFAEQLSVLVVVERQRLLRSVWLLSLRNSGPNNIYLYN